MTATLTSPSTSTWTKVTTPRSKKRATLAQVKRQARALGLNPDEIIDTGKRYIISCVEITPELNARLRAARSDRARPISRATYLKHSRTMSESGWSFDPQSPALVDTNGELVGAGHRLEGANHAKAIIELAFELDVDDSVLEHADLNKRPTLAELMAYRHNDYAEDHRFVEITLSGIAGLGRRPNCTTDAATALVDANYDAMVWLLGTVDGALRQLNLPRVPKVTINPVLGAFAMAWQHVTHAQVPQALNPALRALILGDARGGKEGKYAAMLFLREKLQDGGLNSGQAFALTARAIQMVLEGEVPKDKRAIRPRKENPFPWSFETEEAA